MSRDRFGGECLFNLELEVPPLDCYEVFLGCHRLGSYGFNDLERRDFMVPNLFGQEVSWTRLTQRACRVAVGPRGIPDVSTSDTKGNSRKLACWGITRMGTQPECIARDRSHADPNSG